MIDTNWDIDSYKTYHESDEHWELRRKFMVTHKEKLPEDELVCLAQVFTNIEFLGCRYPNETMMRVAELAKGVVEEFREKKKNTLKRTFVAASDAASSKVKGIKNSNFKTESTEEKESKSFESCRKNLLKVLDGPFSKFVVLVMRRKTAFVLLERSIQLNRAQNSSFNTSKTESGLFESTVVVEGIQLSSAVAVDRKTAQELACTTALEKLRQQCYTILEENELVGQNVDKADLGSDGRSRAAQPQPSPQTDNIGSKLMKLMGWAGGGLGTGGQGRVEPVEATTVLHRAGFGSDAAAKDLRKMRKDITTYLHNWLASGAKTDLLFSSDFNKEERKAAHQIASNMGLKSKSYGKEEGRRLVISKKLSVWDLAQELYQAGGHSQKYQLLKPGQPLPCPLHNQTDTYC